MSANTSIDLVGLDYDQIRGNLKNFMKGKPAFNDVDFEGSNISVLLDVLAYNTYLNGFYLNMVASEMFLDSATQRDSVISHAKELNYLPQSFKSSYAELQVSIAPSVGSPVNVTVPKYTTFTSKVGSNSYSFSTSSSVVLTNPANGVFSANLMVYEGSVISDTFVKSPKASSTTQRFVLSNPTVDTNSIEVSVIEDNGANQYSYVYAESLYNITATSQVYYLQPAENQQYELIFGEDYLGRTPKDGAVIVVTYRACSGELPNGAVTFSADGAIDGHSNVLIQTISSSAGGQVNESIESIRLNAPRSFATQQRAVTAYDYETLLKANFGEISAIAVYGGEDAVPPVYGKVFCSIDIKDADGVPENRKREYIKFLKTKTPLSIDVEIVNPEFIYYKLASNVTYDLKVTRKSSDEIKSLVLSAIEQYNSNEVSGFNKTLRYSRLLRLMDTADPSIISNRTSVQLIKFINPLTGGTYKDTISFGQPLEYDGDVSISLSTQSTVGSTYGRAVKSSVFTASGKPTILVDDSKGSIYTAEYITTSEASTSSSTEYSLGSVVGYVDYATGQVVIESLIIDEYPGAYIRVFATPKSVDVTSSRNSILTIDMATTTIDVVGITV